MMKPLELLVSKAIYDSIKVKVKSLTWIDLGILQQALDKDSPIEKLPESIRRHFLDVGMEVVKVLQSVSIK